MSFVQSFKPFGHALPGGVPQAQVWDCFNRGQVLAAAFEVHEAAMKAGLMPDEATTLSLTLAELCAQSVTYARGGVASVFFSDGGWRLEIADSGPVDRSPPGAGAAHQAPQAAQLAARAPRGAGHRGDRGVRALRQRMILVTRLRAVNKLVEWCVVKAQSQRKRERPIGRSHAALIQRVQVPTG